MFSPDTLAARRTALARAVGSGLVVLVGHDDAPMNYPANVYPFRQDGTFRYYTGLDAPGFALALDAETGHATLFGHDPTLDDVIWEGPAPRLADRAEAAGTDAHAAPGSLAGVVREALAAGRTVHTLPANRADQTARLAGLLGVAPVDVRASDALADAVVAQRLIKTDAELGEIEAALAVTADMHALAVAMAQPGRTEREVAAAMQAVAVAAGGDVSFPIILTRRGEVLHNHPTGARLDAGDLLLIDAGATAPGSGYAGDVTRVAPVGGTFSERQRGLVEAVLASQQAALDAIRPGVTFRAVHDTAARTLAHGLVGLGLMTGDADAAAAAGAHALFFPHGLGHAIGLDVHDMEGLGETRVGYDAETARSEQFGTRALRFGRRLEPGHVVTVEPGAYLIPDLVAQWKAEARHAAFLPYAEIERWLGVGGVRIEDVAAVTEAGMRVLGPAIPKAVADVEAAVRTGA